MPRKRNRNEKYVARMKTWAQNNKDKIKVSRDKYRNGMSLEEAINQKLRLYQSRSDRFTKEFTNSFDSTKRQRIASIYEWSVRENVYSGPRVISKVMHVLAIEYYLHSMAKIRAKKDGIPFDIEFWDIVIPSHCPILKIPLFQSDEVAGNNSPTVDKIIPSLGYTKDNIWVISYLANTMKNNASLEELHTFALFFKENWFAH